MKLQYLDFKTISEQAKEKGFNFRCFVPTHGRIKHTGWYYIINSCWSECFKSERECKWNMFNELKRLLES